MERDVITMQDVFKYDWNEQRLVATGIRPEFDAKLRGRGLALPSGVFEQ